MYWVESVKLVAEGSYPVRLKAIVILNEPVESNYGVNIHLYLNPGRILGPYTRVVPLRPGQGGAIVEWDSTLPGRYYAWACAWSQEGMEDYTCSYPVLVEPGTRSLLLGAAGGLVAGAVLGALLRRRGAP